MERKPAVFDETRSPVLYSISMFLLGAASAAAMETLKPLLHPAAIALVCAVCMVGLAFLSSRFFRKWLHDHWRPRGLCVVPLSERQRPAKALVAMVSKGSGASSACDAVLAHSDRLEQVRLITTSEGEDDARQVESFVREHCPRLASVSTAKIDNLQSIPEAKNLVSHIRAGLLAGGLPEDELVCDFTGLNKQASAGMVLACAQKGARLQYMVAPVLTPELRAGPSAGHSVPNEIEIAYQVEEDL